MDANNVGVAAVLIQEDHQDVKHPIIYFSQKFGQLISRNQSAEEQA